MSTMTACSEDRAAWREEHVWSVARQVALLRADWSCAVCGVTDWDAVLAVHHVTPVDPLVGYRPGCAHHQSNLRVLCVEHHRMEHRALAARPGAQLALFTRTAA